MHEKSLKNWKGGSSILALIIYKGGQRTSRITGERLKTILNVGSPQHSLRVIIMSLKRLKEGPTVIEI